MINTIHMMQREKNFYFTGIFWVLISFWEGEKWQKNTAGIFFILLFFRVTLPLKDFDHTQRPTTRSLFNHFDAKHQPRWLKNTNPGGIRCIASQVKTNLATEESLRSVSTVYHP